VCACPCSIVVFVVILPIELIANLLVDISQIAILVIAIKLTATLMIAVLLIACSQIAICGSGCVRSVANSILPETMPWKMVEKKSWCWHHWHGQCSKANDCTYMHSKEEEGMWVTDWEGMGYKVELCQYFFGLNGRPKRCTAGDSCPWAHSVADKWRVASARKVKNATKKERHEDRGRSSNDTWQEGSVWQQGEEYNKEEGVETLDEAEKNFGGDFRRGEECHRNAQEQNTETTSESDAMEAKASFELGCSQQLRMPAKDLSQHDVSTVSAAEAIYQQACLLQQGWTERDLELELEAMAERELAARMDTQPQAVAVVHREEAEADTYRDDKRFDWASLEEAEAAEADALEEAEAAAEAHGRRWTQRFEDPMQAEAHEDGDRHRDRHSQSSYQAFVQEELAVANLTALSTDNPLDNPTLEVEAPVPQSWLERAVVLPGLGSSEPKPPPKAPPVVQPRPVPKPPPLLVSSPAWNSAMAEAVQAIKDLPRPKAAASSGQPKAPPVVKPGVGRSVPKIQAACLAQILGENVSRQVTMERRTVSGFNPLPTIFSQVRAIAGNSDPMIVASEPSPVPSPASGSEEAAKALEEAAKAFEEIQALEKELALADKEGPDQVPMPDVRRRQIANLIWRRRGAKNAEHQLALAEK